MRASGLLAHFSNFGPPAKIKLVIVGNNAQIIQTIIESVRNQPSSLNPEHVSPAALLRREISRRTPLGQQAETAARRGHPLADDTTLALMRRWYWTRKPEAGYILTDFPATLLQAKVFDEWQDARGDPLDAVLDATNATPHPVIQHYRDQGLLIEPSLATLTPA